jgi:diguanylate cyclase (GGDEF)-like protein/PAS domain S-box-containing protein
MGADAPTPAAEGALADLAGLAARILRAPMASVTVPGAPPVWVGSGPVPPPAALGEEVTAKGVPVVIPDAAADPGWADDPAVAGPPHLRRLVGLPLLPEVGPALGALCVVDTEPGPVSEHQLAMLATVARQAAGHVRRQGGRLSDPQWRALFESSPIAIGLTDETTRIVSVNSALCELLGRSADELIGTSSDDYFHPEDRVSPEQITRWLAASPDRVLRSERRILTPGGERWVSVHLTRISGFGAEPWTLAHLEDITDRKLAERRLLDAQTDLRAVAGIVDEILIGGDAYQTIVEAVVDLARADNASLVVPERRGPGMFVAASTLPRLVGRHLDQHDPLASVAAFNAGRPVWISDVTAQPGAARSLTLTHSRSLYGLPIRAAGEVIGALGVGWNGPLAELDERRVTALGLVADHAGVAMRQANLVNELAAMTFTDVLTGLPNRRHWDHHLEHLVSLTDRSQVPLTVAMVDLDHFKDYNDRHGHPAGDRLLQGFADTARRALRSSDVLARWGGEEFTLSLPCCPQTVAEDVLGRIIAAVPDGQTCSIGYATWDGRETAAELLRRADRALYDAKRGGRNRVVSADGHTG